MTVTVKRRHAAYTAYRDSDDKIVAHIFKRDTYAWDLKLHGEPAQRFFTLHKAKQALSAMDVSALKSCMPL